MTEENKIEKKEETCNCICKSKGFRNFIVVATGTFVGVFCALSLFAALHKPPMQPAPFVGAHMRPPMAQPYHFNKYHKMHRGDFHKIHHHKEMQKTPVMMDKNIQK